VAESVWFEQGKLHVSLLHNPSHLEIVGCVAAGKTRAKQVGHHHHTHAQALWLRTPDAHIRCPSRGQAGGEESLCVQLHGDAAMAGQGCVPETLALADLPGFSVGGSLHVVVNNQVGGRLTYLLTGCVCGPRACACACACCGWMEESRWIRVFLSCWRLCAAYGS
jgi:2-oxoglutarate dehydrogenase complex dehydrogenase (E1) component-like enzyme